MIEPMYDRVLVKRTASPNKSKGGLFIPSIAQKKLMEGDVIAVGQGKVVNGKVAPLQVQVGDTVVFDKHSGSEVAIEGETFILLREERIFGIK